MRSALRILAVLAVCTSALANAQKTSESDPATWPVCRLGKSPIAPGPAPKEAEVFETKGGPVVMSEAGPGSSVRLINCRLLPGTLAYRGADGTLRDLPSNQPFWPVKWDLPVPTPPPAPMPTPPPQVIKEIKEVKEVKEVIREVSPPKPPLLFGISGGFSRDGYNGPIADREVCEIRSWSAFAGMSFGDPHRLFARLTGMAVFVEDDSSTAYNTCCGYVKNVAQGVQVFGGNLEAVGLLGKRNWKVQLALYAEGGRGIIQGEVDRYVVNSGSATVQRTDAYYLFGYSAQWHAGGGAGALWHASPSLTVELAGKYRYPYGYSAGLVVTHWFKKKSK